MTILKRLVATTGTYTDRDGKEKRRYRDVGHLHESKDNRQYITLDPLVNLAALPRKEGDDRVYINLYDPEERQRQPRDQSQGGPQPRRARQDDGFDDDIPF